MGVINANNSMPNTANDHALWSLGNEASAGCVISKCTACVINGRGSNTNCSIKRFIPYASKQANATHNTTARRSSRSLSSPGRRARFRQFNGIPQTRSSNKGQTNINELAQKIIKASNKGCEPAGALISLNSI